MYPSSCVFDWLLHSLVTIEETISQALPLHYEIHSAPPPIDEDKLPVFVLVDHGKDERYAVPSKAADESAIRLLLADCQQESLTVYTDGFRAYELPDKDNAVTRKYVVHGDSECVDRDVYVNTCESHASLAQC